MCTYFESALSFIESRQTELPEVKELRNTFISLLSLRDCESLDELHLFGTSSLILLSSQFLLVKALLHKCAVHPSFPCMAYPTNSPLS